MSADDLRSSLVDVASGTITAEPADASLFDRLGLEPSPRVDADDVERRYLALSRHLHPDFQAGASDDVRELAVQNSALLNEAYTTLLDDQLRLEYLVGRFDAEALERNKALDPMFLMESMEHSEAVESAAGDRDALERLAKTHRAAVDERVGEAATLLAGDAPDVDRAATLLHEARVHRRILRDCKS